MGTFTDAGWKTLTARAAELGREHGTRASAGVSVDSESAARRWLTGITDGDPEVLDALPGAPLSGEYADSYGTADLYRDLGIAAEDDSDDAGLCLAYEDAYHAAVQAEVERRARFQLAD